MIGVNVEILYIAGPMPGLPDYNYPAFNAAAYDLRKRGYFILNPTMGADSPQDDPPGMTWDDYLRRALGQVIEADGVALLDGWEASKGARLEFHVASTLGMPCKSLAAWKGRTS